MKEFLVVSGACFWLVVIWVALAIACAKFFSLIDKPESEEKET